MSSLFACWKIEGTFAVDGETWRINHRFEDKKEFFLTAHDLILTLDLIPKENKPLKLKYKVDHKKETTLLLVSEGEEELKEGKEQDIYIKGRAGYPHYIITVKLIHI